MLMQQNTRIETIRPISRDPIPAVLKGEIEKELKRKREEE